MYFVIHTEDKATKARVGKHVVYNVDWLKAHFNTERKLYEKKGKWIRTIDPDVNAWTGGHRCSECGRDCVQMSMKYCANCGAPMEVDG